MKQVSKKQAKKNAELARIKKDLSKRCYFCGMSGNELFHILPRSRFGAYITEEWNLGIACNSCHSKFDGDREFRRKQSDLYDQVVCMVDATDVGLVKKHFGLI